jgi:hypothetical protein
VNVSVVANVEPSVAAVDHPDVSRVSPKAMVASPSSMRRPSPLDHDVERHGDSAV